MVKLLDKAIEELSKLSEDQQENMAQWILDELEDELRWNHAFAGSRSQLEQLGKRALADHRAARTHELNPDELE